MVWVRLVFNQCSLMGGRFRENIYILNSIPSRSSGSSHAKLHTHTMNLTSATSSHSSRPLNYLTHPKPTLSLDPSPFHQPVVESLYSPTWSGLVKMTFYQKIILFGQGFKSGACSVTVHLDMCRGLRVWVYGTGF